MVGIVGAVNEGTNQLAVEPRVRELLGGAAALRLLIVVWAVAVTVVDARSGVLVHRAAAFGVLSIVVAWTGTFGMWAMSTPERLLRRPVLAVDLGLAALIVITDWYVYGGAHPQSFGSAWPATAVVVVAVVEGWRTGLVAGLGLGLVNGTAAAIAGRLEGHLLAIGGNIVLLATTGAVAGWVTTRLRSAESEVLAARERERFARSLHDGVLQTLAVVQRRSDDAALVDLAREQEWELRRFIGSGPDARADLVTELRAIAARAERGAPQRVDVVVVEAPPVTGESLDALVGASAEAVTNAVKHSEAASVTICVDVGDDGTGASVSVVDDGCGFDPDSATEGVGLGRSIRGRLDEVGGHSTIRSSPGRGTEVTLWVP